MPTTTTDLARLNDIDLTTCLSTRNRAFTRHKAALILAIAEFDRRELARPNGAPSTAAWLVRTQSLTQRTAYEYLEVGRKLYGFPLLTEAFADGSLGYSKVRLILRYMTPDNESDLIKLALAHTITELEALLAGRPRVGGTRRKAANTLSVTVCPDTGEVRLWGRLDPEHGAELLSALKTAELASPEETESSGTRFGAPTATSLVSSFLTMLAMVRSHQTPARRAPGAQVSIIVDPDDNARIPGQPAAQGCDLLHSIINGFLSTQIQGKNGRILHLGRASRLVNNAQEKALLTRWDHRCAVPGCRHDRWLEFHHIRAWASGGRTDLDNLIPLCSLHHTMLDNRELVIVPDTVDPTLLRFRFPGGESYTSSGHRPPVVDAAMGRHSDSYTHGPVPAGDEHLLDIWEHEDCFDDVMS